MNLHFTGVGSLVSTYVRESEILYVRPLETTLKTRCPIPVLPWFERRRFLQACVWSAFLDLLIGMTVLPACMYMHHMRASRPLEIRRGVPPLEPKSQMVVNHHMGAGNPARVQSFSYTAEPSLQPLFCDLLFRGGRVWAEDRSSLGTCETSPGLMGAEEQTQGFVSARQALHRHPQLSVWKRVLLWLNLVSNWQCRNGWPT